MVEENKVDGGEENKVDGGEQNGIGVCSDISKYRRGISIS